LNEDRYADGRYDSDGKGEVEEASRHSPAKRTVVAVEKSDNEANCGKCPGDAEEENNR
jgi:hypothetical protein